MKFRLLTLVLVSLLLACSQDEAASVESAPGVTDAEIVLGAYTDLSGPIAIWGVGVTNGARMRFDEVNAAGGIHGRKIRYVVEDMQYQIPRAIQAANKLMNRDNIFAMVLALGTPANNAVMTSQFKNGVPNLFPVSGARSMVEPPHHLQFTQRGIYYDEIRAAAKYFIEQKDKTTPCVIYQDTEFGQEIFEAAQDQLHDMGMQVVESASHKPTESEFTASVLKLKNAGCDLVLMGTVHRDSVLVLDAARKMEWQDVAWVGTNVAYGQVIADQPSGDGYYAFVHIAKLYSDDEMSDPVRAWWESYRTLFNENPDLPAMEGYRGADVVVQALQAVGSSPTREGLITAIENMHDYTGLFGYSLSFSADNHSGSRTSTLSQVQDGRWVALEQSISY